MEVFSGQRRDTQNCAETAEELLHSSKLPNLMQLLALTFRTFRNVFTNSDLQALQCVPSVELKRAMQKRVALRPLISSTVPEIRHGI